MSDAWKALTIRQFEYVNAGPANALLRISGTPIRRRGDASRPTLRIEHRQDVHHRTPLPAPADPRGVLRAAYSVSRALLDSDSRFWLEHSDGSLTELPPPTPGAGQGSLVASHSASPELAQAHERAARAEAANGRLTASLTELEMWSAELERSLAFVTTELAAVKAAREADERELGQLREALRAAVRAPPAQ